MRAFSGSLRTRLAARVTALALLALPLSCFGCQNLIDGVPEQVADVAWSLPIEATDGTGWYEVIDGVAYVPERNFWLGAFSAIDLETGTRKWRVGNIFPDGSFDFQTFIHGKIYLGGFMSEDGNAYIARLDQATGARDMLIRLPDPKTGVGSLIAVYGDRLMWQSRDRNATKRLVSLDLATLVPEGEGCYSGAPQPLAQVAERLEEGPIIGHNQIVADGTYAYYCWNYTVANENWGKGGVVKIDIATGDTVWAFPMGPTLPSNPLLVNGVLYFEGGYGFNAVDAETGELLWHTPHAVDSNVGATYEKGRLYYATVATGDSDEDGPRKSLWCLNASDGRVLWTANNTHSYSINPQVHDGICYVLNPWGIDLYDAENGTKLGTCTNVVSDIFGLIRSWKYVAKDGRAYLLVDTTKEFKAVRMNFRRGFFGLEKTP